MRTLTIQVCLSFSKTYVQTSTVPSQKGELRHIRQPAQELSAEWLNTELNDGDILFIDSTHTVKSGSDCMHIYLRLLPMLKKRVYIHVHDVFLPFGMPKAWGIEHQIFWTEQHLLLALIAGRPSVQFIFGSTWHEHFNRQALDAFMCGRAASGGGSFWMDWQSPLITD